MKISKSIFIFSLIVIFGVCIIILSPYILPKRFFYDANFIINNPYNIKGLKGSYEFSIWFYHITGLYKLPFSIIGIIQYLICVLFLWRLNSIKDLEKINIRNILFILSLLMIAVFLSMPTKEFFTFVFCLFLLSQIINEKRFIKLKIVLLILGFAYFFRAYYLLVGITSFVVFFSLKIKIRNKKILIFLTGILAVIFISLSYGAFKGEYISQSTRESINKVRTSDGNTRIVSPVSTDTWYGETIGVIYGVYTVNVPLNAFKYFSPLIIVFAIWQLFLIIYILFMYDSKVKNDNRNHYKWLFYFGISYFIVQGLFEPDLGSAIRHKAGIFPLIYFMLYYDTFRKKI